MSIELTDDQMLAFNGLQDFINGDEHHLCLLTGNAGSGKTTLVTQFIQWVNNNSLFHKICISSPTHKALRVLMEMMPPDLQTGVTFSTLHSLLGLKHTITKDGKEEFKRDNNTMSKFPFYDLVIVDEASMIADQLFDEMEDQNFRNVKVLFVGDPNQINPVNHTMAIPMLEEKRLEHNIKHIQLTKIVRQAEGNPIIKFSQKVIHDEYEHSPGFKDKTDDSGIVMISPSQTKLLSQLIKYYFGSSNFDTDTNYCKIIAWRNKSVDYYNTFVRTFKYGTDAAKIVRGEKLIVDKPIRPEDSNDVIFMTNEDLIVQQVEVKEKTLYGNMTWKYYDCLVSGYENVANIHILHESEETRYKKYIKDMADNAAKESDVSRRIKAWKAYFSFIENFAQVKYSFAITAHCSQGSTYENAIVLYSDIMFNKRDDERKRILYTSMTRPKKMLYLV